MRINQGSPKRKNKRLKEPFGKRAKRFAVRSAKVIVVVAALPTVAFGGWWMYRQLVTTEYLSVSTINVAGVEKVTKEEVVELSGIKEGQNILSFKAKDIVSALKKNPWIEEAIIKRSVPDTINIEIKERQPIALVKLDEMYVMDRNGIIFKRFAQEDELDLPVVTGLTKESLNDASQTEGGLLELLKVLSARNGFNITNISEIHVDATYGLSVFTVEDGVRLDLGKEGFEEKFASFEKILKTRDGILNGIEAMDLSNHREVVVRFTTDVVKEGGKGNGQKG